MRLDIQNFIINSGMSFWQRGGAPGYSAMPLSNSRQWNSADRHFFSFSGTQTGTPSVQGVEDVIPQWSDRAAAVNYRRNADAFTANIGHVIEAGMAIRLAAYGHCSFSVQVLSPEAGTQVHLYMSSLNAKNNGGSGSTQFYHESVNILSGSYQKATFNNISIPANAVNGIVLNIVIVIPSGTDATTRPFYIGQLMLNQGRLILPWQPANLQPMHELMACQRFFQNSALSPDVPITYQDRQGPMAPLDNGWVYNIHQIAFQTTMFKTPTITTKNANKETEGTAGMAYSLQGLNEQTNGYVVNTTPNRFDLYMPSYKMSVVPAFGYKADAEIKF